MSCRAGIMLFAAVLQTGCPLAGGVPPSRTEVGLSTSSADRAHLADVHFMVGTHVASAVLSPTLHFDAGAGYLVETVRSGADPSSRATTVLQGAYVEGDMRLPLFPQRWTRSWLGWRAELLVDDASRVGAAAIQRIAWEAVGDGTAEGTFKSRCGAGAWLSYGVTAIGFFLEGGYQWLPHGEGAFQATTGLTVRLPAVGALGLGVPGCK